MYTIRSGPMIRQTRWHRSIEHSVGAAAAAGVAAAAVNGPTKTEAKVDVEGTESTAIFGEPPTDLQPLQLSAVTTRSHSTSDERTIIANSLVGRWSLSEHRHHL